MKSGLGRRAGPESGARLLAKDGIRRCRLLDPRTGEIYEDNGRAGGLRSGQHREHGADRAVVIVVVDAVLRCAGVSSLIGCQRQNRSGVLIGEAVDVTE